MQLEQAELALCVFMQVVIGLGVFGKGPYQEKAVFWTPFSLCQSTQCSPHPQAILPFHYISSLKLGFECLFMPVLVLRSLNHLSLEIIQIDIVCIFIEMVKLRFREITCLKTIERDNRIYKGLSAEL